MARKTKKPSVFEIPSDVREKLDALQWHLPAVTYGGILCRSVIAFTTLVVAAKRGATLVVREADGSETELKLVIG